MAWQRYMMMAILLFLVFSWFYMPRVTERDSVAWAEALFLEHCRLNNLLPEAFGRPSLAIEGGDKDLIYAWRYPAKALKGDLKALVVRIHRMGQSSIQTIDATGHSRTLIHAPVAQ